MVVKIITKYYLQKMGNRLIQDVNFWKKENKIDVIISANLIQNIKQEINWAKKRI